MQKQDPPEASQPDPLPGAAERRAGRRAQLSPYPSAEGRRSLPCPMATAERGRALRHVPGVPGWLPGPPLPARALTPGIGQSLALAVGEEPVGLKLFAPEGRGGRYASVT